MTDGRVGAAKGDFDHDDVEGQTDTFVLETPATELFVGRAGFDGDERVWVVGGVGEESDAFEFGARVDAGFE